MAEKIVIGNAKLRRDYFADWLPTQKSWQHWNELMGGSFSDALQMGRQWRESAIAQDGDAARTEWRRLTANLEVRGG